MAWHMGVSSSRVTVLTHTNYVCRSWDAFVYICVYVCCLLWSNCKGCFHSVYAACKHLLNALPHMHVWIQVVSIFICISVCLGASIGVCVCVFSLHLSPAVLTCWSPSQFPAPLLRGQDAGGGARLCPEPWSFQTAGSGPGVEWTNKTWSDVENPLIFMSFITYQIPNKSVLSFFIYIYGIYYAI